MTRLSLVLAAAVLLLPGAARAAACSPLNCAPSQFTLAHGLLGYRAAAGAPVSVADLRTGEPRFTLPAGLVFGERLVHRAGRTIEWYDATTGEKTGEQALPWNARLAGASQDGRRAVAFRAKTSAVIVWPGGLRVVSLPSGTWDFDALRGNDLYLIRYLSDGYQVRLLDLARPDRGTRLLRDPRGSGTIWGSPFSRLASPDGRFLFTLYLAGNGAAMVHELDLATRTARCLDLPGTGDYGAATSWGLVLAPDHRTLWAVAPGYGRAVAIDILKRQVRTAFPLRFASWNLGLATRTALSPDGTQLALANGEEVAVVDLRARRVLQRKPSKALAVGYAPTGELRTLP